MSDLEDILKELSEGIQIKPCVQSGFCCTQSPCTYGEWNEDESACKHLTKPNDVGQMGCDKYDWIKENVPGYEYYPAFGAGCSSTIGNEMRQEVIKKLNDKNNRSNE